jgi:large subunit ribosomal protein L23
MSILKRPVITEKATAKSEKLEQFTFKVDVNADKPTIKKAIEKMYGVNVVGLSTMHYSGKKVVKNTTRGLSIGKKESYKKAIVTLRPGQTIKFFENV